MAVTKPGTSLAHVVTGFPLRGEINGVERNPFDIWSRLAKHPITQTDFHYDRHAEVGGSA